VQGMAIKVQRTKRTSGGNKTMAEIIMTGQISLSEQLVLSPRDAHEVVEKIMKRFEIQTDFATIIQKTVTNDIPDWSDKQCFLAGFIIGRMMEHTSQLYQEQESKKIPDGIFHAS
jgi:hypothetical protein